MASPVSKAHASYVDKHLHIMITGADPHHFQRSDVGKRFVRTQPYYHYKSAGGRDMSYLAEGLTERSIRECALRLVKWTDTRLEFRGELSLPWESPFKLENPDWNDGNWIEIEKCVAICKNNLNLEVDSGEEDDYRLDY